MRVCHMFVCSGTLLRIPLHWRCEQYMLAQGGHGTGKTGKTGKTGNCGLTFSRQGKHREFCCNTGKVFETQGKYF